MSRLRVTHRRHVILRHHTTPERLPMRSRLATRSRDATLRRPGTTNHRATARRHGMPSQQETQSFPATAPLTPRTGRVLRPRRVDLRARPTPTPCGARILRPAMGRAALNTGRTIPIHFSNAPQQTRHPSSRPRCHPRPSGFVRHRPTPCAHRVHRVEIGTRQPTTRRPGVRRATLRAAVTTSRRRDPIPPNRRVSATRPIIAITDPMSLLRSKITRIRPRWSRLCETRTASTR